MAQFIPSKTIAAIVSEHGTLLNYLRANYPDEGSVGTYGVEPGVIDTFVRSCGATVGRVGAKPSMLRSPTRGGPWSPGLVLMTPFTPTGVLARPLAVLGRSRRCSVGPLGGGLGPPEATLPGPFVLMTPIMPAGVRACLLAVLGRSRRSVVPFFGFFHAKRCGHGAARCARLPRLLTGEWVCLVVLRPLYVIGV